METNKIRAAILKEAQGEVEEIIANARVKAEELMTNAKEQKKKRFEEEKNRVISEARREASRILAQSSLKARQEVLKEKDDVINEIISRVKKDLLGKAMDETVLIYLIGETVQAFETEDKLRLLVSPGDIAVARKVVKENDSLKEQIAEIVEFDCLGGVMAESMDGMVSIDNTFDMRLEMLTPKILPRISRELFGDDEK